MIWSLIVGGFIGFIAGAITKSLAGMALIPSIIGAVIVVAVVSFFFGKRE